MCIFIYLTCLALLCVGRVFHLFWLMVFMHQTHSSTSLLILINPHFAFEHVQALQPYSFKAICCNKSNIDLDGLQLVLLLGRGSDDLIFVFVNRTKFDIDWFIFCCSHCFSVCCRSQALVDSDLFYRFSTS